MQAGIGEFGLIDRVRSLFEPLVPRGMEGIGDDCAVIDYKNAKLLITTDMLCQDVHFRMPMSGFDLGRRAVQVNLSDIAAMGGVATAIFLSIALPVWVTDDFVDDFMRGVHSCGVPLLGGDTTRSQSMLCVSVTAVGEVPATNIKRRSGARVGDAILVAGRLGGQAASGFVAPVVAQCAQGAWLGGMAQVHAMMDISDGLAGDLPHILAESKVGARVELCSIPIADGASEAQALGGGEDFVLLLTCEQGKMMQLQDDFHKKFSQTLYEIGRITASDSAAVEWLRDGHPTPLTSSGFRHF